MKTNANAKREAQSLAELKNYLNGDSYEYGMYSGIFDRGNDHPGVDRYLERGECLPSAAWTHKFVQAGGAFDSCLTHGIAPKHAVELERQGVPAEFAAKMLNLLGRGDFDYLYVGEVYVEGFNPQKRSEFHAAVRGIKRQAIAEKASAKYKSTIRLGWMIENEFYEYIIKNSNFINNETTSQDCFNGCPVELLEQEDLKKIKNPVFRQWLKIRSMIGLSSYTSSGMVYESLEGVVFQIHDWNNLSIKDLGRKIAPNMLAAKVKEMWFVWDPSVGFQRHMENSSLREGVRLWQNRSYKTTPRLLTLNDVRNDRSGTAGFCLTGTKNFLEKKMPHLYRLVRGYDSWAQIPDELMSLTWDVDFKIFQGYPIP